MIQHFKRYPLRMVHLAASLTVLLVLALPLYLPAVVQAQGDATATPTFRLPILIRPQVTLVAPLLLITPLQPTTVVTNVQLLNLNSTVLSNLLKTTADLNYTDQFSAKIDVESPATMQLGDTRVITLQVTPQFLAQASAVRAELIIVNFDSRDDGQPDKTVLENVPVSWSWVITPKNLGSQEFFLAISYVNQQGSWVHWQNITLDMNVSLPPSDTPTFTPSATVVVPPASTFTPTVTPAPTATQTNGEKLSTSFFSNPAAFLTILVTLLLGLLGLYIQSRNKK